ncbi:MAG TPA: thiamine phosphate synthase [Polyangia bacterium]|jgi:thiamine-phosphate pyrophosphorylase|nr:thiamine phosphate synthase [Polyangia bacterium]
MFSLRGFYAIVDATPALLDDTGALERRARQLLEAAPCCLQLRAKEIGARAFADAARRLLPLCRGAGVPFCVNDRLDVALSVGADVVHLGQDDLPLADALRVRVEAGRPDLVVGFSTHNPAQAISAAGAGADYLGFGPVFVTNSKLNPDPVVGLNQLAEVCRIVSVPVVAIGGVTPDHAGLLALAGASAAALISAVNSAPDPTSAGRQVGAAWTR